MDEAFEQLVTERLVLRRFTLADAEPLAMYRSLPDVARYQSWHAPFALERARVFVTWLLEQHPDTPGEWFQLAVARRERPEELIGDCAIHPRADEPRIVDVGFTFDPTSQGMGYATEAVGEVLRYLFEDRRKHKAAADCDTRNTRSWRLLERLGFRREGVLRDSFDDGEVWASEFLYGLLADDWRAARPAGGGVPAAWPGPGSPAR